MIRMRMPRERSMADTDMTMRRMCNVHATMPGNANVNVCSRARANHACRSAAWGFRAASRRGMRR